MNDPSSKDMWREVITDVPQPHVQKNLLVPSCTNRFGDGVSLYPSPLGVMLPRENREGYE